MGVEEFKQVSPSVSSRVHLSDLIFLTGHKMTVTKHVVR